MIELPSRDVLVDDVADSAVRVESRESVKRVGKSTLVGDDRNDSGSSVRVFEGEPRESFERVAGDRSSKASCSSNWAIGEGEASDGGSECIKVRRVYMTREGGEIASKTSKDTLQTVGWDRRQTRGCSDSQGYKGNKRKPENESNPVT